MRALAWIGRIVLLWCSVVAGRSWGEPLPAVLGPELQVLDVGAATEVTEPGTGPEPGSAPAKLRTSPR
jgi:hypothetical protein